MLIPPIKPKCILNAIVEKEATSSPSQELNSNNLRGSPISKQSIANEFFGVHGLYV
jgi:hypothetical protein